MALTHFEAVTSQKLIHSERTRQIDRLTKQRDIVKVLFVDRLGHRPGESTLDLMDLPTGEHPRLRTRSDAPLCPGQSVLPGLGDQGVVQRILVDDVDPSLRRIGEGHPLTVLETKVGVLSSDWERGNKVWDHREARLAQYAE